MAHKTRFVVTQRRKREGRTNYKGRMNMLKSGTPRLVIRKSNKHILAQIVEYAPQGDKVVLSSTSKELIKMGWKGGTGNLPAAYLTGMILAKKAKAKNVESAIVDLGRQQSIKGSRVYALVKGAVEAGLDIPCDEAAFPSDERLSGAHIDSYKKSSKQFTKEPSANTATEVAALKKKILV